MATILTQARAAGKLLKDASLLDGERLAGWFEAMTGLDAMQLPEDVRPHYKTELKQIREILFGGDLEPNDADFRVTDHDIQQVLVLAKSATQRVLSGEEDRLTMELDDAFGHLPVDAIQEIRDHRDMMTPVLIHLLKDKVQAIRNEEEVSGNLPFFTLFLLSEFNAKESLPQIIQLISLPEEHVNKLFGDAITEIFCRVLAQLAVGQDKLLDELIANRDAYEYVRWAAATALILMVRDGSLARKDAVRRLQNHLQQGMEQNDQELVIITVSELLHLSPSEAADDMKKAFERDLIPVYDTDIEELEASISGGEEFMQKEFDRLPETGIKDTIEELRTWFCYNAKSDELDDLEELLPPSGLDMPIVDPITPTVLPASNKIGRNEPCPCGSGKKYKKCCGKRG